MCVLSLPTPLQALGISRRQLEQCLRDRVLREGGPRLHLRDRTRVAGLVWDDHKEGVTGEGGRAQRPGAGANLQLTLLPWLPKPMQLLAAQGCARREVHRFNSFPLLYIFFLLICCMHLLQTLQGWSWVRGRSSTRM